MSTPAGRLVDSLASLGALGIRRATLVAALTLLGASGWASTSVSASAGESSPATRIGAMAEVGDPVAAPALDDATAVSAGYRHTCVVRRGGTVACWGSNELGYDSLVDRLTPVAVPGLNDVTAISAGVQHTCALRETGQVACWGWNGHGQLGNDTLIDSEAPVEVHNLLDAIAISVSSGYSCALRRSGQVACWGANDAGQLGDDSTQRRSVPVAVHDLSDATAISAGGGHACALRQSGQVVCWGWNDFAQLGDGTTESRLTPVEVTGVTDATAIAAALHQSCALRQNGHVACWGSPTGSVASNELAPVEVGVYEAVGLSTTWRHACTLRQTGQVDCWGRNVEGQLGLPPYESPDPPYPPSLDVGGPSDVTAVSTGGEHTCALRQSGQVACWGQNANGQLGDASTISRYTPESVEPVALPIPVGLGLTAVGDSVSAGEGIGYGYEWDNSDERWKDRTEAFESWDTAFGQPFACHQSPEAHPRVLAALIGAELREHLSCTGATFDEGIAGVQDTDGVTEPQIGGFLDDQGHPAGPEGNPRYSASHPDVVTLSLGANDIGFSDVVTKCFYPDAPWPPFNCRYYIDRAKARLGDFLRGKYAEVYQQIQDIGANVDKRPVVLHTRYIDPFPTAGQDHACFDIEGLLRSGFSREEINEMRGGLATLNEVIETEAAKVDGVIAVPVSPAFNNHTFCSDDPWVFGMDTAIDNRVGIGYKTRAPFHPTARGQLELARQIQPWLGYAVMMQRTGTSVQVPFASGEKLTFATVTVAGATVATPQDEASLPEHRNFKVNGGWLIETAAEHSGAITVTLPAEAGDKLWHFVNGAWESVAATFDGTSLSGDVLSLSPFAVGPDASPVTARITAGAGGVVPHTVAFSAADSDGDTASVQWDFGDGGSATGLDVQHLYRYSGSYDVQLTTRGTDGALDRVTKTIQITNPPPTIIAEVPASARVGDDLELDSRASTDSNGEVTRGWWEVDGRALDPEGQRSVLRADHAGTMSVVAVVLDDELLESRRSFTIEVREAASPPGPPPAPTPAPLSPLSPLTPGPLPGSVTTRDRTAPHARLSGALVQRLLRHITVSVRCLDEPCHATASGRVTVRRGAAVRTGLRRLLSARRLVARGARTRLKPALSKASRAAIRRTLSRHGKVAVQLKVTVRDTAGNPRALTRRVRLRL